MFRGDGGSNAAAQFRELVSMDVVNIDILHDLLVLGSIGFVVGVLFPWAFRLVGYVLDAVRKFVR